MIYLRHQDSPPSIDNETAFQPSQRRSGPKCRAAIASVVGSLFVSIMPSIANAELGVVYHSLSSDFSSDYFLPKYHLSGVSSSVNSDLDSALSEGFDFINTRVFIGEQEGISYSSRSNKWMMAFPPTSQDLDNFEQYVDDVNAKGLALDISLQWTHYADVGQGCVDPNDDGAGGCMSSGLGFGHISLSEYRTRMRAETIAKLLQRVSPGEVRSWTFFGDANFHPDVDGMPYGNYRRRMRNNGWQFENGYGYLAYLLNRDSKGNPTVEFLLNDPDNPSNWGCAEDDWVMCDGWHNQSDSLCPSASGHRTMYHVCRSLMFINDTFSAMGWPSSWKMDRVNWGHYFDSNDTSVYGAGTDRILEDAQEVIPTVFGVSSYGNTETSNFTDSTKQSAQCQALSDWRIESSAIWSTPYKSHRLSFGNVEMGMPVKYCN